MLLDSNILIYFGQLGGEFLERWVKDSDACIASVTCIETLGFPGWHLLNETQRVSLETSVMMLPLLPLSGRVTDRAVALRRQKSMKLGDAIIAATALVYGLPLVTRNVDDFRHVAGLELVNPFENA